MDNWRCAWLKSMAIRSSGGTVEERRKLLKDGGL